MTDSDEISLSELVLEGPPSGDISTSSGSLFGNDALPVAVSKLAALEQFLVLMVKDCRFDDFMRELLLVFMKVVRSEAGSIFELDRENRQLFFRAIVGTSSDKLDQFTVPLGKGIVGHVAESRQPLVVANVEENRVHLKAIQDAVGFEARNLVAIPIMIRGEVYGVLELLNRVGEENFSSADVELLSSLCEAAAKIIEVRLMIAWAIKHNREAA